MMMAKEKRRKETIKNMKASQSKIIRFQSNSNEKEADNCSKLEDIDDFEQYL